MNRVTIEDVALPKPVGRPDNVIDFPGKETLEKLSMPNFDPNAVKELVVRLLAIRREIDESRKKKLAQQSAFEFRLQSPKRPTERKPIENEQQKPHNKDMTDVTIELLDAKLQAAEARTEARVARLETLVETNIRSMEEFKKDIAADSKETKKYLSNLKLQAALFSIAMAASVIFGIAAFNSTLLSNMMGSFDMGQTSKDIVRNEVAGQIAPLVAKIDQSDAKLDKVNETLNRLISAPAATPNVSPSPSQSPTPEPLRLYK